MVRVNVGIKPYDLTDEHLMAENVEILMLLKFIEKYPNGNIPKKFSLGKGHISFFRDKGNYLFKRGICIQDEMMKRGIKINKKIRYYDVSIPKTNMFDYIERYKDSEIVSKRIVERIKNPIKKKSLYRWYGNEINKNEFIERYKKYGCNE